MDSGGPLSSFDMHLLLSFQDQLQYTDHSIYVSTVQSLAMHMPPLLLSFPRIYSSIFLTIQFTLMRYFNTFYDSSTTQY
jgi:hypothetical protein